MQLDKKQNTRVAPRKKRDINYPDGITENFQGGENISAGFNRIGPFFPRRLMGITLAKYGNSKAQDVLWRKQLSITEASVSRGRKPTCRKLHETCPGTQSSC